MASVKKECRVFTPELGDQIIRARLVRNGQAGSIVCLVTEIDSVSSGDLVPVADESVERDDVCFGLGEGSIVADRLDTECEAPFKQSLGCAPIGRTRKHLLEPLGEFGISRLTHDCYNRTHVEEG